MCEIELKIYLNEEDKSKLTDWLGTNAEFVGEEDHQEIYFDNPSDSFLFESFDGLQDAEKYLRVRKTKKGESVCLKIFEVDKTNGKSKNLDEIEMPTDFEEMRKLLVNLGYSSEFNLSKTRKKYIHGNFEIVIDSLKTLGEFAEIELIEFPEDEDIGNGFKLIYDLLREMGFSEVNVCKRGYISMLWNGLNEHLEMKSLAT